MKARLTYFKKVPSETCLGAVTKLLKKFKGREVVYPGVRPGLKVQSGEGGRLPWC